MFSWRWILLCLSAVAYAQDPFEIQVFEYEPLPLGRFTYEEHINYVPVGSTVRDGPVAPLQAQLHLSSEFTAGITEAIRAGVVALTAYVPGRGMEFAGVRILPHFYAPPSWNLPLNLGFVTEFSFERTLFDEDTRDVELRAIVEKHIGRLQMDGNLVAERALHGPGVSQGWAFEPSGRIGWQASGKFTPSLEYYGYLGEFGNFLPARQQGHLFFPGGDWRVRNDLMWSFGVGIGSTDTGLRVVLKSRIEFEFGRRH